MTSKGEQACRNQSPNPRPGSPHYLPIPPSPPTALFLSPIRPHNTLSWIPRQSGGDGPTALNLFGSVDRANSALPALFLLRNLFSFQCRRSGGGAWCPPTGRGCGGGRPAEIGRRRVLEQQPSVAEISSRSIQPLRLRVCLRLSSSPP